MKSLKIYWPGEYKDLSEGRIMEALTKEGFNPIKITNGPQYVYPKHTHPEEKLIVILEGGMDVVTGDKTYSCKPGDKLLIPGGLLHSAVIGNDGCSFFWAER